MTAYAEIEVQRNAEYSRLWRFTDTAGDPIDITGTTFEMDVKYAAGPGDVLASFVVTIEDATGGEATVAIDGSLFGAVPGDNERVVLAYDLIAVQGDNRMPLARGPLHLLPGVS